MTDRIGHPTCWGRRPVIQAIPDLDLMVVITSDGDQERSDPQF